MDFHDKWERWWWKQLEESLIPLINSCLMYANFYAKQMLFTIQLINSCLMYANFYAKHMLFTIQLINSCLIVVVFSINLVENLSWQDRTQSLFDAWMFVCLFVFFFFFWAISLELANTFSLILHILKPGMYELWIIMNHVLKKWIRTIIGLFMVYIILFM